MTDVVAVVGASLAGAKAAETLRDEGFDGDILLIGDDPERPYERPPLSKWYLQGGAERDEAFVHDAGFYGEQRITTMFDTRVTSIDAGQRRLVLDDGDDVAYDWLILATGARPRRLDLPGANLAGIRTLRTLADSDLLKRAFEAKPRLVVVGAGFIGAEVAASARVLGLDVTVLEMADVPLQRALGREIGERYARLHRDHGVDLRTGVKIDGFVGGDAVEGVLLAGNERVPADLVVVGVGVQPNDELARAAGLDCDGGVVADEYLQTSDQYTWACGDVANAWHPLYARRLRVEHWANALNQPRQAARNLLARDGAGRGAPYDRVPYFYSDQYETSMEYVGHGEGYDDVVIRGDAERHEFTAFYLRKGRVLAAMAMGRHDDVEPAKALIAAKATPDRRALADPEVAPESLA